MTRDKTERALEDINVGIDAGLLQQQQSTEKIVETIESTKTPEQRKAQLLRRAREAYTRQGLDYDAEMAKRKVATDSDQQGAGEQVPSYLRDLYRAANGGAEARQRLVRDAADPAARAGSQYRAISTTDNAGGQFAKLTNGPNFLVDAVALGIQPEAVLMDLLGPQHLPEHGIHISTPQITTATAAGSVAENSSVANTDPVTALIDVPKVTIAGRVQVSQQLLELGGLNFDQMIGEELGASNQGELERQLVVGNGTAELQGFNGTGSINTVAYTDASPTLPEMLAFIGQLFSLFAQNRKRLPDAVIVSTRRWAWMLSQLDSNNQPIMLATVPPIRTNGSTTGLVGSIGGVACYASAAVPSNLGGGTNEDRIFAVYSPDVKLYLSPLFLRMSTLEGGASVASSLAEQIVLYRYSALILKHANAIGNITGTGMILPAGF